ncbi:hypothetical protein, partial [Amycolatopsis sp. NPDC051061]|uniref:hypothetical protein n=1 Tax=Amycolatopsis sp. NPDC051061 TaxID=3155042 RepID=UPI00343995BF
MARVDVIGYLVVRSWKRFQLRKAELETFPIGLIQILTPVSGACQHDTESIEPATRGTRRRHERVVHDARPGSTDVNSGDLALGLLILVVVAGVLDRAGRS